MSGFTDDQLEARRQTLGASEIPAVIGISPYKGAFELWLEKRGLTAGRSGETPWQAWGLKMEPVIAEAYTEFLLNEHGVVAVLRGDGRTSLQISGRPWSCTPDRLVDDLKAGEAWGVDFKQSRYGEGYGQPGTEEVPAHVYAQCQWSMLVADRQRWDVAALIGGSDFRVYHLMRNGSFILDLLSAATVFWKHVTDGTEPPMDGSSAAKRYLQERFPEEVLGVPLPVRDDPETLTLFQELRLVKAEVKRAEERQATLENQIKRLIGDAPGIVTPLGKATWKKVKDREVTDWQAIVQTIGVAPGVIARYTELKPGYRRFLFTPTHTTEDSA